MWRGARWVVGAEREVRWGLGEERAVRWLVGERRAGGGGDLGLADRRWPASTVTVST